MHITCDHCGKQLRSGQDHFVVKIEVFAAHDPAEITEADLEEDHMEAVSQLLQEMEETDEATPWSQPQITSAMICARTAAGASSAIRSTKIRFRNSISARTDAVHSLV